MDALDSLTHRIDIYSLDGRVSLCNKIAALHVVFNQCSSKVLQFGQLVSHRPGILESWNRPEISDMEQIANAREVCF